MLNSALIYRGRIIPTGTFQPGDTIEKIIRRSNAPAIISDTEVNIFSDEVDNGKKVIFNHILKDPRRQKVFEDGSILLIGWLLRPPVRAEIDRDFRYYRNYNLAIITITVEEPEYDAT